MNRWSKASINAWLRSEGLCGQLADEEWISTKHRHNWRCFFGHDFSRKFEYIKATRRFCPRCAPQFRMEDAVRFIFEQLLAPHKFAKTKPDWLRDEATNALLELDGFSEPLSVAFEYDGEQHSEHNAHFHPTQADFVDQQRRDELKDRLCEKQGITLIRVNHTLVRDEIEEHVIQALKNAGFAGRIFTPVNWANYNPEVRQELAEEAQAYASKHDGECRTSDITSADQTLTFYCKKHEHQWTNTLKLVRDRKREGWCIHCGHERGAAKQKKNEQKEKLRDWWPTTLGSVWSRGQA